MTDYCSINKTDLKILTVLQTNARMTNQELAERVHLSPSACLSRVKRLEADGILKRFISDIDIDRLGPNIQAFAEITLENHFPDDFNRFDKEIADVPEVTESFKISGAYDYLIKFTCTDVKAYNQISDSLIKRDIGIAKVNTLIILEQTKEFSGYAIDTLIDL